MGDCSGADEAGEAKQPRVDVSQTSEGQPFYFLTRPGFSVILLRRMFFLLYAFDGSVMRMQARELGDDAILAQGGMSSA